MGLGGGGVVAGRAASGESATTGVGGGSTDTGGGSATGRAVSAGAGTVGTGAGGGPAVATVAAAPAGRDSVRIPAAASQRNRSPNTRGTQSVSHTSGRKSVSRA